MSDSLPNNFHELLETIDGVVWAKKFVSAIKDSPSIATHEDTMVGWFTNAIMTGFDEGQKRNQGRAIAMDETENTDVANKFLNAKVKLSKEIDKAQKAARTALQLACKSGTAEEVLKLAVSIKTIDDAWHINQKQVKEFWDATARTEGILYSSASTSHNIYRAAKFSEGKE